MRKETQHFIYKDIISSIGAGESSKVFQQTTIHSGITELVIEKTIREYYPIQHYEKVMDLFERLNCVERKIWSLEEIAHPFNPNK